MSLTGSWTCDNITSEQVSTTKGESCVWMRLETSTQENGWISPAHRTQLARSRTVWRFFLEGNTGVPASLIFPLVASMAVSAHLSMVSRLSQIVVTSVLRAVRHGLSVYVRTLRRTSSHHFFSSVLLVAAHRCHCVHVASHHRR